jgi:hypothetical protein
MKRQYESPVLIKQKPLADVTAQTLITPGFPPEDEE